MINAILFDLDGTLIDSEKFYMDGTLKFMRKLGYNKDPKELYQIIGSSMKKTYDHLEKCLDYRVSRDKIIRVNEEYFGLINVIDYQKLLFDDVEYYLRKLKRSGIKLGLCSQSEMALIQKFLNDTSLTDVFDYVESGESITNGKPAPDIYLKALEALNVMADEVIIYEDSKLGIEAGNKAGIRVAARIEERYGFDQSAAEFLVKDISEFYKLIRRLQDER